MTPVSVAQSLLGGVLIGSGASLLYASIGRIAGVSGILAGLVRAQPGDWGWRVAFLLGLLLAGTTALAGSSPTSAASLTSTPPWLLIPAGLCIGFGARQAGGCTSGHGICGISRLSLRSFVATPTFIATGALAVFVLRHVMGGR